MLMIVSVQENYAIFVLDMETSLHKQKHYDYCDYDFLRHN